MWFPLHIANTKGAFFVFHCTVLQLGGPAHVLHSVPHEYYNAILTCSKNLPLVGNATCCFAQGSPGDLKKHKSELLGEEQDP